MIPDSDGSILIAAAYESLNNVLLRSSKSGCMSISVISSGLIDVSNSVVLSTTTHITCALLSRKIGRVACTSCSFNLGAMLMLNGHR